MGPTSSYHPLRLADTLANHPRLITPSAQATAAVMKPRSGWARSLAPVISSTHPSASASVSTAHISAHTSKVALLRKLPEGWIHNISCGFKWVRLQAIRINQISACLISLRLISNLRFLLTGGYRCCWVSHQLVVEVGLLPAKAHKLHSLMCLFHLQAVQVTEYPAPPPEKADGVSCGGNTTLQSLLIKVGVWVTPFCIAHVLSSRSVQQCDLYIQLFGDFWWPVCICLSHGLLSALMASGQIYDAKPELFQSWSVTQLISQHTQWMGHLLLS